MYHQFVRSSAAVPALWFPAIHNLLRIPRISRSFHFYSILACKRKILEMYFKTTWKLNWKENSASGCRSSSSILRSTLSRYRWLALCSDRARDNDSSTWTAVCLTKYLKIENMWKFSRCRKILFWFSRCMWTSLCCFTSGLQDK